MVKENSGSVLFFMITLFICGEVLFLIGFFPVSYTKIHETIEDETILIESNRPSFLDSFRLTPPSQKYEQTILMLVDALRHDFPTASSMPFAYDNACAHLKMHVGVPTVTMPRLKSITTGTLSNFIDIILNLGQAEQLADSVLHRIKKRGDTIVFAGDRTWVNLFPSEFGRKEPNTDSFFVQDFYEGDKNVTRTLMKELQNIDWHLLIIHYLGLDHIGHVEGSASLKIPGKLKEMDGAVKEIYNSKNHQNQLLIVSGDHGMRNGGGHGGSTPEELHVPLLFFKANCTKKSIKPIEYNQIDLAPTLAILMSIEIPTVSIGCLIPELLQELNLEDQLYAYYYNAQHLVHRATLKFGKKRVTQSSYFKWFGDAKKSHKQFLKTKRSANAISTFSFEKAKLEYTRAAREISSKLSESLVSFDYGLIVIGLSLTNIVTAYTLVFVFFTQSNARLSYYLLNARRAIFAVGAAVIINGCGHLMQYIMTASIMYSCLLTVPIFACIYLLVSFFSMLLKFFLPLRQSMRFTLSLPLPLLACFAFHTFSLASSSFIEEEHQTWYYLGATLLVVLFGSRLRYNVRNSSDVTIQVAAVVWRQARQMYAPLFMLSTVPILRRINQTGDKWRHLQDFGDILNKPENKLWLSLFFIFGLLILLIHLRRLNTNAQMVTSAIATLCIYCFHGIGKDVHFFSVHHYNKTRVLGLFWISVGANAVIRYKSVIWKKNTFGYKKKPDLVELLQTNMSCSLLIAALLHKPHNVILLTAMLFTLQQAYNLCDNLHLKTSRRYEHSYVLVQKTVLTIFVANMFYFYQGNSNSLATINLNPGYIGQTSYNPVIVAIFVTFNTYCSHITAFTFLVLHIFKAQCASQRRQEKEQITNTLLVLNTQHDLQLVISLYTASTLLPVAVYLCLLVVFRYHLFIYTVFAPKVFYECFSVVVFYLNFSITNLYLKFF